MVNDTTVYLDRHSLYYKTKYSKLEGIYNEPAQRYLGKPTF
jgi:hypothetical protein